MRMKPRYRLTRAELVPPGAIIYTLNGKSAYRVVSKTPSGKCKVVFAKFKGPEYSRNWFWKPNQRCWVRVKQCD